MKKIVFMIMLIGLAGCGEAWFYQDIRLEAAPGKIAAQLISTTASDLGYIPCYEKSYCDNKTGSNFSFEIKTDNEFEILFSAFGSPVRQGKARNDLAAMLSKKCPECKIKIRDRSDWGFVHENSGWKDIQH